MAAHTIVAQPIPSTGKHIRFDRLTKDFAMYLDGQYLGSRATHDEAEIELDRVAYDQARTLAADLADEAAETEATCVLCGDPASVTLRVSGETLRLCRPCFDAGWGENEANLESWEADFDACSTCAGAGRIPNGHGTGDQAGGWADTCPDCGGTGTASATPSDEPPPVPPGQGGDSPETGPYADDVAALLAAPAHALWGLADFAAEYDAQARLQRALASWSTAPVQETSRAA